MPSPLFPNSNNRRKAEQQAQNQSRNPVPPQQYSMFGNLRNKISAAVLKALGPTAQLVESLLRPFGRSLAKDINQEIDAAHAIAGVLGQPTLITPQQQSKIMPARPEIIVGGRRADDDDWREPDDPGKPIMEGPIKVTSSNVYSIAYLHRNDSMPGDLIVTFLGGPSNNRHGQGSTYAYKMVPVQVWESFKIAQSAGKFVWQNLRVPRSLIAHQYDYTLLSGTPEGYVPRQIAFRTGMQGIHYVTRTIKGRRFVEGHTGPIKSTLPPRQAAGPRGPLPGWDRRDQLQMRSTGRR